MKKRCKLLEPSDDEVRDILVRAMADVGADPALVFAFAITGVYICDENERKLPKEKIAASISAVDRYFDLLATTRAV